MSRVSLWAAIAAGALGCSPVVGAECADGYAECQGRCVDLYSDTEHCGACGSACPTGSYCSLGECTGAQREDAGGAIGDAGVAHGDRPPVGWIHPGHPLDVPGPSWTGPSCDIGELRCGEACVRPDTDPSNCGACGVSCGADGVCAGGSCAPACEPPFELCNGICADTRSDPDHCGACGARCGSGVCVDSECRSPLAGHLVVIGHDYRTRREAMSRLVGNAVLLSPGRMVQVATFAGASSEDTRDGTDRAIATVTAEAGRGWLPRAVGADDMSYQLAGVDALLVYAQPALPAADAAGLGARWSSALRSFLDIGGTVIVLVGAGEGGGGALRILEGAGLVTGGAAPVEVTGELVRVTRPWDALATGVALTYRAEASTVRLPLGVADAVVEDDLGPIVVHRTLIPR